MVPGNKKEVDSLKLNYKRTMLIGLAFLSISAFWQMYDGVIPKILTNENTFNLGESVSGLLMAADNVLALFLLPLFGTLSDKCRSRLGRRTPYILVGTILAAVLMNLLPLIDNSNAAVPASWKLPLFIGVLLMLLVSMSIYRSPAVALMPDVTPKPLRSKANAVINLMGAVGGILYLIIAMVLYPDKATRGLDHVNYQTLFLVVSGIMVLAVAVLLLTVREPKLAEENARYEQAHPEENLAQADETGREVLPKPVKRSLLFLLLSVAFWYVGYNGITTWFTKYAEKMWHMEIGSASKCLTIAMVGAIVSYLPAGMLATRFGRKKTILAGVGLLAATFCSCFVYTLFSDAFSPALYVIFVLVGMAWATINVNSLPMVVEMCKKSDVGKFTGYYYAFSMAAQIVTPVVAGWLLEHVDYRALFPYATAAVVCALVTMTQVRHGDSKAPVKRGLEAFEDMD